MISKLCEKKYFKYQEFIIDNAKLLSLSSDEALVLIKLLDNYPEVKTLSIDKLVDKLPITKAKVEKSLSSLMERGFYELYINYENGVGQEFISLDGFFKKAEIILEHNKEDFEEEVFRVNQYLAGKLNRILTSSELDIISSLIIDDKYVLTDVKNACDQLEKNKKIISMKSMAQILAQKNQPDSNTNKEPSKVLKNFLASIK